MRHAWKLEKRVEGIPVLVRYFDGYRKAKTIGETLASFKLTWKRQPGEPETWVAADSHLRTTWVVTLIGIE